MTYDKAKALVLANVLVGECSRCGRKKPLRVKGKLSGGVQLCPCGRYNYWRFVRREDYQQAVIEAMIVDAIC